MLTRSPIDPGDLQRVQGLFAPTGEEIAAVQGHRAFPAAMRASALTAIELYRGNRLLNAVASDRGRFLLSMLALYLHETLDPADPASGLTASRLQGLAARTGLCSEGRAKTMIALMRWAGYLETAPSPDARVRRLAPTDLLREAHAVRWRRQLGAAGMVLPAAREALRRFDEPGFVGAFALAFGSGYLSGYRILDAAPEFSVFAERNAGMLVLCSLIVADPGAPVSVSDLARRFCVSRAHVSGLFRDAADLTLVHRDGERVTLSPALAEAAEAFFANAMLYNAWCGTRAVAALDDAASRAA